MLTNTTRRSLSEQRSGVLGSLSDLVQVKMTSGTTEKDIH